PRALPDGLILVFQHPVKERKERNSEYMMKRLFSAGKTRNTRKASPQHSAIRLNDGLIIISRTNKICMNKPMAMHGSMSNFY
ncbi:MAG TPA: hypothetical protein PKV75_09000, partial [Desulfobacterales bacterium]|nr:hypothetical protein [Desulfobacterales bacterium]